jgi:predicted metal-binding membrane protein
MMLERREIREMDVASVPGSRPGWTVPEWAIVAASAAAWISMAVPSAPHAGHAGHLPDAALRSSAVASAVMVVAMMLPLALPHVRHVAATVEGPRRHVAVAAFLAGYLAVWTAAQLAIAGAFGGVASAAGWTAAAGAVVAAAALWELAPARRRMLRRCHRMAPLAPGGWRAERDCAAFGAATGGACVATCWALMAACAAFAHSLPLMAVLFGVQLSARYREDRSAALAALAVAAACLLSIAARLGAHHAA